MTCGSGTLILSGTGIRGALLDVASLKAKRQFFFEAYRNRPGQPAHFRADLLEADGDVAIVRSVRAEGGPQTFSYGPRGGDPARVWPPEPFSGSAVFYPVRGRHGRSKWTGDLRADFPGKRNASLVGSVSIGSFNRNSKVIHLSGE